MLRRSTCISRKVRTFYAWDQTYNIPRDLLGQRLVISHIFRAKTSKLCMLHSNISRASSVIYFQNSSQTGTYLKNKFFGFLFPNLRVLGVALEEVHEMVEVCVGGLRGVGQVGLLHWYLGSHKKAVHSMHYTGRMHLSYLTGVGNQRGTNIQQKKSKPTAYNEKNSVWIQVVPVKN